MATSLAHEMRPITLAEARRSYEQLQQMECKEPRLSRVGLKTLDRYFFGARLRARVKGRSFAEYIRDEESATFLSDLVRRYRKKEPDTMEPAALLREQYAMFQLYYGSINQFRPAVAKWIYCKYKPRVGVLDFSAGWGGRALGAMAEGVPYVGIDTNTTLRVPYSQMFREIDPVAAEKVRVLFAPSETVNFAEIPYDLVLTSPPYFMLERYERMPAYATKAEFLERFFRPVIGRVWQHLRPGGHMILNMPGEMYEAIKDMLPPLKETLEMRIHSKHPKNAARGLEIGASGSDASEAMYVWQKVVRRGRQTRRVPRTTRPTTTKN